jgi:hypothetical protein
VLGDGDALVGDDGPLVGAAVDDATRVVVVRSSARLDELDAPGSLDALGSPDAPDAPSDPHAPATSASTTVAHSSGVRRTRRA